MGGLSPYPYPHSGGPNHTVTQVDGCHDGQHPLDIYGGGHIKVGGGDFKSHYKVCTFYDALRGGGGPKLRIHE